MDELKPYYLVRMTERQVRTLKSGMYFMRQSIGDTGDDANENEWVRLLYDLRSILRNIEEGVDVNDS